MLISTPCPHCPPKVVMLATLEKNMLRPRGCPRGVGQGARGMQPQSSKCVLTLQTNFGKCEHAGRFILFLVFFYWKVQTPRPHCPQKLCFAWDPRKQTFARHWVGGLRIGTASPGAFMFFSFECCAPEGCPRGCDKAHMGCNLNRLNVF